MTMRSDKKSAYNKEYRKLRIHRVVIFSKLEYEHLMTLAKKHRKGFSTLVREFALSQSYNQYLLPFDEATQEVKILLIRYGTNLNQISHLCNADHTKISSEIIIKVQAEFKELQKAIIAIYDKPMRIVDLVRNTLIKTPSYSEQIRNVLTQLHL